MAAFFENFFGLSTQFRLLNSSTMKERRQVVPWVGKCWQNGWLRLVEKGNLTCKKDGQDLVSMDNCWDRMYCHGYMESGHWQRFRSEGKPPPLFRVQTDEEKVQNLIKAEPRLEASDIVLDGRSSSLELAIHRMIIADAFITSRSSLTPARAAMDSCAALFARPSLELEPPFKLVGSVLSEESSLEDPPSDAESLPWSPTGSAGEHSAASRRADVPEHPFDAPQQDILSQTQVMSKVLASLCDAQQYHMPRYKNWKNTKPERSRTALRQRPPWSGHRQRHGVPGSAREGILKVLRQLFGRHFQDEEVRVEQRYPPQVARPGVGLDGTLELPRLEAMIYGRAAPLSGCCGSSVLSFFDATCGVAVICVRRTCAVAEEQRRIASCQLLRVESWPLRLSIWGPYLALTDGVLPKHRPPPAARATHAPEMTTHAGGLKEEWRSLGTLGLECERVSSSRCCLSPPRSPRAVRTTSQAAPAFLLSNLWSRRGTAFFWVMGTKRWGFWDEHRKTHLG
eukprot:g4006.t2